MIFFRFFWLFFFINSMNSLKITNLFLEKLNKIKNLQNLQNLKKQKNIQIRESLVTPENKLPVTGFYGLIGPKLDYRNITSLYDLFTGDGIIQGIFLENGTATFTQTLINTEKLEFEKIVGKPMIQNSMITGVQMFLNFLKLIPNMLGVANTAFLNFQNKTYVLFERDMPYEIYIDSERKMVETVGKKEIPFLQTFSGHSKVVGGKVETIDCDIIQNKVNWYQMDIDNQTQEFRKINEYSIPMAYIPLVHDFYSDENYVLLINSPLKMDWSNIVNKQIPIFFDGTAPTFIYLIHKKTGKIETYKVDKGFYLFHYADVKIKDTTINILSPFYDRINYNEVLHFGKYRRLRIDRNSGNSQIFKYRELEPLNLDFPVALDNKNYPKNLNKSKQYILRSIENGRINGFYILEKTDIVKKIVFKDYFICGEPGIFYMESEENKEDNKNNNNTNVPILCFFAFLDNNNNNNNNKNINEPNKKQYFIMVNLETDEKIEYPISNPLFIGFHSIVL